MTRRTFLSRAASALALVGANRSARAAPVPTHLLPKGRYFKDVRTGAEFAWGGDRYRKVAEVVHGLPGFQTYTNAIQLTGRWSNGYTTTGRESGFGAEVEVES